MSEEERQNLIRMHKQWAALANEAGKARRAADSLKDKLIEALINQKGMSRETEMALLKVRVDSLLHPERYAKR